MIQENIPIEECIQNCNTTTNNQKHNRVKQKVIYINDIGEYQKDSPDCPEDGSSYTKFSPRKI